MGQGDPELAAEVVCAIARSVLAAGGDAGRLRAIPLGNTVARLMVMRDEPADPDHRKLVGLAVAVQRARDGDADALGQLPGFVRAVREWFGLRD